MIALESSTCNTEFGGMIDNVWPGTTQEVGDSDRLWRELMSTNRTLVITLVTTEVPHVDRYFWYQNTTFGYIIDRVWPETAQEVSDFNMILTVCGGSWCTHMYPDFVIRSAILHKYCDRIDVKSVSFLRLNKHIGKQQRLLPFYERSS